jgi:PHD/YefM family antitoxin component YafN of YafNO toxin-antitoxin module
MSVDYPCVMPIAAARGKLDELADQVLREGQPVVLERAQGEPSLALIAATDLDDLHQFRHRQRLSDLMAAMQSLEDITEGRTRPADEFLAEIDHLIATLEDSPQSHAE